MTTDNTHIRRIMIRKNRNPSVEIQRKISLSSSPMNQSEYMKSSICTDKSDCAPSLIRSCKVRRKRVLKFDPKFEEFLSHNHKSCLKDLNCSINTYEGVSDCFDDKMKKKLRARVHKSCSRERPNRRRPKITISNEILIVQENFELPDIKKASEGLQTLEYKRNISKNSKKKIGSEKPGESRNKTLKQKIRSRLSLLNREFRSQTLCTLPRISN
ncbi:unnamed protein product [Moneuplotes crassus]|uniref:Uncharacterized protein n=1 Tax=Euplotes crassus TaxID=5936 RepID=A0AAD1X8W3_EUPCR|nr:unnamed protein product [Moneuplotes crassus]